jgi:magnesium-transporting ATPase (P-type)
MKNTPTANQLAGRAIGSIFFAVFGALWIILALYAKQLLSVTTVTWVAMDFAVLLVMAMWLFRQARRFARSPEDPAQKKAFNRINVIQWVAVAVTAFTFARLHLDAYVMCAITAIVGLHMFPLARLFRYPMHYVTGTALLAWAATSAIAVPADQLQGTCALGTGILLWLSAFATLVIAATLARRASSSYSVSRTTEGI